MAVHSGAGSAPRAASLKQLEAGKVRALFDLGPGYADIARVLDQVSANRVALPPGCEVTYELEAIDILRSLVPSPRAGAALMEA